MYKRVVSDDLLKVNVQKNNNFVIVYFNVIYYINYMYVNLIALQFKFVSKIQILKIIF